MMETTMTNVQIRNAERHMESSESLWIYFGMSGSESGAKQFLGCFAMMSLLAETALLDMELVLKLRASIEVFFTTSWGPAKCINVMLGKRFLRDWSPQDLAHVTKEGSSVTIPAKRLVTAGCLMLMHTSFGKLLRDLFAMLRLPNGYACVISFFCCELRKYFKPGCQKYRGVFEDPDKRKSFMEALSRMEGVSCIGNWCDVSGLPEAFILSSEK